ncbi:hypothetical protein CXG81DRAFT_10883 [Caulochytrium protostelioides]|uniref:Uncharacterized protein n=1 Tax=Caulochytrium protostelioides TaxID=1555241 RepID=A0A4P9XAE7_9FUNG|nr:hypothetical protein CXG81DRAFT_10883 [Caulochytrium protostelioides]|eukprot:RKP02327.1 hypothetical protein CXG81DRAFT_10883 [Caulochytrium protostelioides]
MPSIQELETTATTAAAAPAIAIPSCPPVDGLPIAHAVLEFEDGTAYEGFSFGASRSVSGECVFQTGMVGYPESLTDPSYREQVMVCTFPLAGNYGVPDRSERVTPAPGSSPGTALSRRFESDHIAVAALVVANYTELHSHCMAHSSLSTWLVEEGIPAIYGIDTRAVTKKIRESGAMLCRVRMRLPDGQIPSVATRRLPLDAYAPVAWHDPGAANIVKDISVAQPRLYCPAGDALRDSAGRPIRIVAVDVGMKFNQIRCFLKRRVEVLVVPWNYAFAHAEVEGQPYHGLFISNGPGDPAQLGETIAEIRKQLARADRPIFGICLGHQLLALAAGAQTHKMKFGNRGQNIPCIDRTTGRCYITSQNHGYAVNAATLPAGWVEYFVNANDQSNEGIRHTTLPYYSVQFHPESAPGPWDAEILFDHFIEALRVNADRAIGAPLKAFTTLAVPQADGTPSAPPPAVRLDVKKVLILGSGGLSIGQAGEFDYSGSQAIKALKSEGIDTVLINPNIATIQTSKGLADKVYFLPVTPEFVRQVIQKERPDGIYCTFGGQTALNVGIKMRDEFEALGVRVLGTPISTIEMTEDRELFAAQMAQIGERCAQSASAVNWEEARRAALEIGFPVIVRAAYALGGLGSGFASDEGQLLDLCTKAFATSPQVLVEKSMKGWKEIEYEVVRDAYDNCVTVCNMENFDPLGIHTGDSIVVAPSQTLSDSDYMMLRRTAINVIRHLGVVGECNIQYALNPTSKEYSIIEVNARLSRSSALASKATGYPLAFVAAKLGLGIPLPEVRNSVTQKTTACFEPSLDYVIVKIPRWDLKKFQRVSTKISSSMKSVGEVMAVGRSFEETIQEAIRAVDGAFLGFAETDTAISTADLDEELENPSDQRLFAIANALHRGYTVDRIWEMTRIDKWFLHKLAGIVAYDRQLRTLAKEPLDIALTAAKLRHAKQLGFSDRHIAQTLETTELAVRRRRKALAIFPYVKQIDTVAAEFPCYTNYLYMTYLGSEHDVTFGTKADGAVIVLGSGVYRIGSSIEFDWCAVRCIRTLRAAGAKTIMINYNPETVSTDYDEADRLYFEELSLERVLDVYELEQASSVVVSMGGQSPNNIAMGLHREGVHILGTSPEMIDSAENRYKFSRLLDRIHVDQPEWKELTSNAEASVFCDKVGFPVLVRPSYVLSGAAMNVVYSTNDLDAYLDLAANVSREFPVVVTKYLEEAKEIECDAVARNGEVLHLVISEHVENAGVHSGDATLVLPPQDLDATTIHKIEQATRQIADALMVTGPFNIQFMAKNNAIKVIECNVRASRSFPFISKVLGVDMIELATRVMADLPVPNREQLNHGVTAVSYASVRTVAIKVPQFSFSRLSGADPILGVEMASTGEVACFGRTKYEAYLKGLLATSFTMPKKNVLLSIGSFKEKMELLPGVRRLHELGYQLFATAGTADFMSEHGIPVKYLEALDEDAQEAPGSAGGTHKRLTSSANSPNRDPTSNQKNEYSLSQHLANNLIDLYINLPSKNKFRRPASYMTKGYRSRRMAVDFAVPLITNVKIAKLFIEALARCGSEFTLSDVDCMSSYATHALDQLVAVIPPAAVRGIAANIADLTAEAITAGFTTCVTAAPLVKATQGLYCDVMDVTTLSRAVSATGELMQTLRDAPQGVPVVVDSEHPQLTHVLYIASLLRRPIHVSRVRRAETLELIGLAKTSPAAAAVAPVSCDVAVADLFDPARPAVAAALFEQLASIDCFSIVPIDDAQQHTFVAALTLLLTAVHAKRLTLDAVRQRLSVNPARIFGIAVKDAAASYASVEIDRPSSLHAQVTVHLRRHIATQCPEAPPPVGLVERTVLRGQTVYGEGAVAQPTGTYLAPRPEAAAAAAAAPVLPAVLFPPAVSAAAGTAALQAGSDLKSALMAHGAHAAPLAVASAPFYQRQLLSVAQSTRADLHALFGLAQEMRRQSERVGGHRVLSEILRGRVLCTAFFEASTRTSCSFEAAMLRLGGAVVPFRSDVSSLKKGETFADTVQTLSSYADALVIRHPDRGAATLASQHSAVPVINAGDGVGEHPTQALLDVFTIREELGTVNGLIVTLVGDLKNGRTVHSLAHLLLQYQVTVNLIAPPSLAMPDAIVEKLRQKGMLGVVSHDLAAVMPTTDVLYVTRIQRERFDDVAQYHATVGSYVITNKVLQRAKPNMIVMHPLPRVDEIAIEVDADPRAAYFRQMKYGMYVRMALLALILGGQL